MKRSLLFFFFLTGLSSFGLHAQCPGPSGGAANCDPLLSQMLISNTPNVEFSFDSFSRINAGLQMSGSTILRVKAVNNSGLTCKWNLIMYVYNMGGSAAPDEWTALTNYGASGGTVPELDLIEVRVTNACGTPANSGQWQTFSPVTTGASLRIINDLGLNLPGTCNTLLPTNTAGSYLNNYSEYSFTIDYRIQPGLNLRPGRYNIKIVYCLSEML
jgi:hypothetical protein